MSPDDTKPSQPTMGPWSRVRVLLRNPISLAGIALALVALANIVFLFAIDVTSEKPSPYIGILAYMVGPAFLIAGLALVPLGYWWDQRRRATQKEGEPIRY